MQSISSPSNSWLINILAENPDCKTSRDFLRLEIDQAMMDELFNLQMKNIFKGYSGGDVK